MVFGEPSRNFNLWGEEDQNQPAEASVYAYFWDFSELVASKFREQKLITSAAGFFFFVFFLRNLIHLFPH